MMMIIYKNGICNWKWSSEAEENPYYELRSVFVLNLLKHWFFERSHKLVKNDYSKQ